MTTPEIIPLFKRYAKPLAVGMALTGLIFLLAAQHFDEIKVSLVWEKLFTVEIEANKKAS